MIKINIKNIEELIFFNSSIRNLLSEFSDILSQWSLGIRIANLGHLRKKSAIELLNKLNDSHIDKLKTIFNDDIVVEKINPHLVQNHCFSLADIENSLNNYKDFTDNYIIHRDKEHIYISFWR